jgi:tRNA1(Val) A37 N6-methylase TrmN6
MSKNTLYTFDYFQPPEYHFSLDSVFLAQIVAKQYQESSNLSEIQVLDLCSGCGVIGLELSIHLKNLEHVTFVEIQEIYTEFFKKNLYGIHKNRKNFEMINMNYDQMRTSQFKEKFDLILSNPPYFFRGEGLYSPSEFKNRCRFFMDSNFEELIKTIEYILSPKGEAYLLIREGSTHGRDPLADLKKALSPCISANIFDNIRGTMVVRIKKI